MRGRIFCGMVLWLAAVCGGNAQTADIDTTTPEGALIQTIGIEQDPDKKIQLCEDWLQRYSDRKGAEWVYSQLLELYVQRNHEQKAEPVCQAAVRTAPENLGILVNCLKCANARGDAGAVLRYAGAASELARKQMAAPKPVEESEVAAWESSVEYARQVQQFCEYSLYAGVLKHSAPASVVALYEALEQMNSSSEYLQPQIRTLYFVQLQQIGQKEKALAYATERAEKGDASEEMLLAAADQLMQSKKAPQKVIAYSERVLALLKDKQAPEGTDPAAWQAKRDQMAGLAGWMAGITYALQNRWLEADRLLRPAVPLLKNDQQLLAGALFYLGLANYKLGDKNPPDVKRIADAVNFTKQCAAIRSPYQAQAQQNLKTLTSLFRLL